MDAVYCLAVRFKAVKQDPRVTRRSASDGADFYTWETFQVRS